MKATRPWIVFLMVMLVMNAAMTVLLAWKQARNSRNYQLYQAQVKQEMNVFRSLMAETMSYSSTNSSILPVLKNLGIPMPPPDGNSSNQPSSN